MEPFEGVYRTHFGDVYRYLLKLTGSDQSLSEELTSETFLRAMNSFHRFRGDCQLRTWLCQIARNCYLDELRRRKRTADAPLDAIEDTVPTAEEALLRRDTAQRAYALVHQLEEPYKEVFLLRSLGELSFRQIGALFGRSENWACVTYHRARKNISQKLEETR